MANITQAQVKALFSEVRSRAKALAVFPAVIGHDPESSPPKGLSCSVMLGPVKPVTSSGLAAVSLQVTLMIHVFNWASRRPLDEIDPDVLWATCSLMGAFAGDFTLDGTVREVDLFAMTADPGYVDFDGAKYRAMVITLPLIFNDAFEEVA